MSRIVPEQFAALTKDGQPIDAAFRAAAKVSARVDGSGRCEASSAYDMNEFTRLSAEQRGGSDMPDTLLQSTDYRGDAIYPWGLWIDWGCWSLTVNNSLTVGLDVRCRLAKQCAVKGAGLQRV